MPPFDPPAGLNVVSKSPGRDPEHYQSSNVSEYINFRSIPHTQACVELGKVQL